MTSKQNRLSASRAVRTEAMRRSMGSICKSSFCFQLLYSESLPWSRTIQNLSHISNSSLNKSRSFPYLCQACLLMPLGSMCEPGRLNAHSSPSFLCWPLPFRSVPEGPISRSSRSRMPLNLFRPGEPIGPPGDAENAILECVLDRELLGERATLDLVLALWPS